VVSRLIEEGLLDDERFARRYAEDKRELAGWGPERIREALLARGVARDLVEAALEGEGQAEQLRRAVAMPSASAPCGCSSGGATRWS